MWKLRTLLATLALFPMLALASPKELWIAYYIRFTFEGHTYLTQSRALWTEGSDLVVLSDRWKFVFVPKFDSPETNLGTMQVSVMPASTVGTPASAEPILDKELPFQMGILTENRQKDDRFDIEMTFIVSPETR